MKKLKGEILNEEMDESYRCVDDRSNNRWIF